MFSSLLIRGAVVVAPHFFFRGLYNRRNGDYTGNISREALEI